MSMRAIRHYTITTEELEWIGERIEVLQSAVREICEAEPAGSRVLRTCLRHAPTPLAAKRLGHTRRPPGRGRWRGKRQARFSRLGAAHATPRQTNRMHQICNRILNLIPSPGFREFGRR
jgi:hypothetical protein